VCLQHEELDRNSFNWCLILLVGATGFEPATPCAEGSDSTSLDRSGGRTWWAHPEFTRVNIELTIRKNQMEEAL